MTWPHRGKVQLVSAIPISLQHTSIDSSFSLLRLCREQTRRPVAGGNNDGRSFQFHYTFSFEVIRHVPRALLFRLGWWSGGQIGVVGIHDTLPLPVCLLLPDLDQFAGIAER